MLPAPILPIQQRNDWRRKFSLAVRTDGGNICSSTYVDPRRQIQRSEHLRLQAITPSLLGPQARDDKFSVSVAAGKGCNEESLEANINDL